MPGQFVTPGFIKRPVMCAAVVAFGVLVLGGFVLALAWDGGIVNPTPVLNRLEQLPPALRVIVWVAVGVPVGLGVAIYLVLQVLDFIGFVTSPVEWLRRLRGRR